MNTKEIDTLRQSELSDDVLELLIQHTRLQDKSIFEFFIAKSCLVSLVEDLEAARSNSLRTYVEAMIDERFAAAEAVHSSDASLEVLQSIVAGMQTNFLMLL